MLSGNQYPAVFVDYDGGGAEGFSHRVNCEFQYNIYVYVMEDSAEHSMEKLEDIYWKEIEGSAPAGIIPVLLSNAGFQAGGIPYRMTVGRTKTVRGKPESDRFTGAMMVPITVTTLRNN